MRWCLLLSFLFCFSALAEVVCRAPSEDEPSATQAGSTSAVCNPSATETSREENPDDAKKQVEYLANQEGNNNTPTSNGTSENIQ